MAIVKVLIFAMAVPATTGFSSLPRGIVRIKIPKESVCFASFETEDLEGEDGVDEVEPTGSAATNTVNQRLMAELEEATTRETTGKASQLSKKLGLDSFRSTKTDEERQRAIEEAKNLNGVNPLVAFAGAVFALAMAAGMWALTGFLAAFFADHPASTEVYFVMRATQVFRNVVMGLVSLASGFFGVTGIGILLLAGRVALGVMNGELDPTPIKKSKKDEIEMPNVWELMTKSNRRRGR